MFFILDLVWIEFLIVFFDFIELRLNLFEFDLL